jgi:murein DD-endopeptidase MepM/ murein hydrolase activator NlpD
VLEVPVTVDLPEKFIFSGLPPIGDQPLKLTQGQLLEIEVYYADDPEDILFEQSIYDGFRWYQENGYLRGYLPTNYNVKPGEYIVNYGVKSKGTTLTQHIELAAYDYHIQYLTVDPQTEAETRNDAAYAEYHKYYTPVRNQSEPSRYYTEGFLLPVSGRLTTEFGSTRYVNDLPTSYRHLGLDIATAEGTEVKAANRGKVVLARLLTLTGNTVMIDHGEGLFSVYHHMLSLSVKAGEIVERGQKIGEVGSTGFSTGPHLHFMMSYYTMNLEPGYFLVGQPITFENYQELISTP